MLTKNHLEALATAMHDIEYVIIGQITAFSMEFDSGVIAHVEWTDEGFKLSYTEEIEQ